jgi:hypothetical protein
VPFVFFFDLNYFLFSLTLTFLVDLAVAGVVISPKKLLGVC